MKKAGPITLTLLAAMGFACSRNRPDPCEAATFNQQACNEAVRNGGYYYDGTWVPMSYHYSYPYYYDIYRSHLSRGGSVVTVPASSYATPAGTSRGVTRGGFGSTGEAHAGGAHGAGE
jgi:hypothetical protein